jgi:hypothetical protein
MYTAVWLDGDRKTLAILIAEYADAVFFGSGWFDCDAQLDSVTGNILEHVAAIAFDDDVTDLNHGRACSGPTDSKSYWS